MAADKRARKDFEYYKDYRDGTQEWREQRDRMVKFTAGAQWSGKSSKTLETRDQVDIVVNKIRPLIKMRASLMAAGKPTGYIYGVDEDDTGKAALLNQFIDWHWYNSDGQIRLIRAVKGQNIAGVHWLLAYSDNQADYGRGELRITDVSYRNVFLDKGAAEWDFRDAPRIIHTKLVRPDDFYLRNSGVSLDESLLVQNDEIYWTGKRQHAEDIEMGTPQNETQCDESWIREVDVYEKKNVTIQVVKQKKTGIVLRVLDDGEELNETEKRFLKRNITDQDLIDVGLDPNIDKSFLELEEAAIKIPRIEYRKSASGIANIGKSIILPISDYPIVPIIGEDTGNSMPLGEVDHQYGIQELLNTCVSLTLLNAALGSNLRMLYDPNYVGELDEEQLNALWATPGSWIPMKMNPVTGKFPVEPIRPEPLNQAWFQLSQILAQEIEFQISTFSLRTGDPTDAPETFGATLQLGQWAQDILRIPLTYMESGLQKLFNVILEWIPKYYDFEKIFYILGDEGKPVTRVINPQSYNDINAMMNSLNTITNIKASYRIRAGSTMPAQSVAEMQILQSMAQLNPSLITKVIDRMPGLTDKEKKEVKTTLDQVSQLGQENSNLQEILKSYQAKLQQLQNENIELQRAMKLNQFEMALKKEQMKQESKGI